MDRVINQFEKLMGFSVELTPRAAAEQVYLAMITKAPENDLNILREVAEHQLQVQLESQADNVGYSYEVQVACAVLVSCRVLCGGFKNISAHQNFVRNALEQSFCLTLENKTNAPHDFLWFLGKFVVELLARYDLVEQVEFTGTSLQQTGAGLSEE